VNVFLVRHAHAVDEAPGLPDAARHLTPTGRDAARALGVLLRANGCRPDAVWSSPLVRAVQTAELLLAGLQEERAVEAVPDLASGNVRALAERVRAWTGGASIALVGHEPSVSGLGALLTARGDFPALHKAEAARLDDPARGGAGSGALVLRWTLSWDGDGPRNV
jgi:phosphohistidine phosphatase